MTAPDIRPSPIAGTWYPENPKILAASIDKFLAEVKLPKLSGQVIAVIAPHAGHRYSGAVAAHAFATLHGLTPDLAAVISPFHNYSPHPLLTTKHQAYATPLGELEVDRSALAELQSQLPLPITPMANDREHSLEIELPFLQRIFKNKFKLLPIMLRAQEDSIAKQLGEALAHTLQHKNAILIASTDLSHFYDQRTASTYDQEMLKRFEAFDPASIFEAEQTGKGFACGHAAVAAVMWAAQALGANKVQVLKHATSGDVTGDYSSVVGYGAAVILKQ
ncbi:MAG: AmmeMemoRadiSam system protein B [Anaerolineales bacterium]|uniref:AmmeMemoRadiSam system protein B n=1 Tax=Candidatus Villigracilis vicinus TaxID=3140679 RepID=UPI0031354E52|nr:AmmeMemoRadiSam system protein B [Anaerolineales bacterium]